MYPFERFTNQAKAVLTLAQEEAEQSHHSYIGSEHLLFGLFRQDRGVASRVLTALGLEIGRVRAAIEAVLGKPERIVIQQIIPTSRVKKIIEIAFEEARNNGDLGVGTEHLLIGLLIEGGSVAARVLNDFGVTLESVRDHIIRVRSEGTVVEERSTPRVRQVVQRRYSDQALRILQAAEHLTGSPLRGEVHAEHLLRALLDEDEFTRHILSRAGADVEEVRRLATPPEDIRSLQEELREHRSAKEDAISRREFDVAARHRELERSAAERLEERRRKWVQRLE